MDIDGDGLEVRHVGCFLCLIWEVWCSVPILVVQLLSCLVMLLSILPQPKQS